MISKFYVQIRKNHQKPPQMAFTECPRPQYLRRSHLGNPIPERFYVFGEVFGNSNVREIIPRYG